jgi:hypothetical protein
MTVLSLEDSKALYDAGIKIETKYGYPCKFLTPDEFIDTPWLLDDAVPMKRHALPAPDLEELLEYAPIDTHLTKERFIIPDEMEDGMFPDNLVIYTAWCSLKLTKGLCPSGDTPLKAISNLLLKLKEEGYEV